jgi:hypothetical protein
MEDKVKFPLAAINPVTGALLFEWFMYSLETVINDSKLNIYIINEKSHVDMRKKYGPFATLFVRKLIVNQLDKIEDIFIIGEFLNTKLIIASLNNIEKSLIDRLTEKNINYTIGATASKKDDNVFSIIQRASRALDFAQENKIKLQIY